MPHALVLDGFSVSPASESEFNQFYHHEFLPKLEEASPEIANLRRFEEFALGGSARWYRKQFLTIYQLTDGTTAEQADAMFGKPEVKDVVLRFRERSEEVVSNFSRTTFLPGWCHARTNGQLHFTGPMFFWQLEMKPELDAAFQKWYEQDYLPLQVAEIPTWAGCRRYKSVGTPQSRHLTVFETSDESTLSRSLQDLRAVHRIEQNLEWQKRVEPAVTWQDASTFRPIFRWPD